MEKEKKLIQLGLGVKACACGIVLMQIAEDYRKGLIDIHEYEVNKAYWKGRADAYKDYSKLISDLALLDDANITHSC